MIFYLSFYKMIMEKNKKRNDDQTVYFILMIQKI